MEKNCQIKPHPSLRAPLLTVLFAVMALGAAITAKMCVTDAHYAPVTPDFGAVSITDSVTLIASAGRSAAVQMLVIFASGFTPVASAVSAVILAYRGICAGYASAALSLGMIDPAPGEIFGVPGSVIVPALYILATVPVIAECAAAISYSNSLLGRSEDCSNPPLISSHFLLFILLSGVSVLISVLASLV